MKIVLGAILLVSLMSCGSKDSKTDLKFYPVKKENFQKYINQKPVTSDPNLLEDIHIINREYPIEISLYKDGRWYYNLDNLDDGFGTWEYKNGKIQLYAHRILFDMNIDIHGTSEGAPDVVIKFSDRHGQRTLPMEKRNL